MDVVLIALNERPSKQVKKKRRSKAKVKILRRVSRLLRLFEYLGNPW